MHSLLTILMSLSSSALVPRTSIDFQCSTVSVCVNDLCVVLGPRPNGTACDDGNVCTTNDTCQAGFCRPGAPLACDDGESCTVDTCEPGVGCVNEGPVDEADADQQQTHTSQYSVGLRLNEPATQSFTVGRDGQLVGLELGLYRCNRSVPGDQIRVLVAIQGHIRASFTRDFDDLSPECHSSSAELEGPPRCEDFFDLRGWNIAVRAGDVLEFSVFASISSGTCVDHTCVDGPRAGVTCGFDSDCRGSATLGAVPAFGYEGGDGHIAGVVRDFQFRTFVE